MTLRAEWARSPGASGEPSTMPARKRGRNIDSLADRLGLISTARSELSEKSQIDRKQLMNLKLDCVGTCIDWDQNNKVQDEFPRL